VKVTFSISDTFSEPVKFVSSQENNKKIDTRNGTKKYFILNSNLSTKGIDAEYMNITNSIANI
jgi:hypothetical protein